MVRTRVGYTGGSRRNPTYRSMGDHTEALEVEFDPSRISYDELLDNFWSGHDPGSPQFSVQYRNALFYHDEGQRAAALASRDRVAEVMKRGVTTAVEEAGTFYQAEDYHQKYYLRGSGPLWEEIRAIYPDGDGLVRSTAAARLNGYVGGYGTESEIEEGIEGLGLSTAGRGRLRELARTTPRRRACPLPRGSRSEGREGSAPELSAAR